jgi:hypothetical protein
VTFLTKAVVTWDGILRAPDDSCRGQDGVGFNPWFKPCQGAGEADSGCCKLLCETYLRTQTWALGNSGARRVTERPANCGDSRSCHDDNDTSSVVPRACQTV